MNKFVIKICIFIILLVLPVDFSFADIYWPDEVYKDGEPDYSDGDLEDKLGDSGYYADLFPEDVEDDYCKPKSNSNTKTDINNPITVYQKDVAGWYNDSNRNVNNGAIIQGTSANVAGKIATIGNVGAGVYVIDGKIYYIPDGTTPFRGWLQVNTNWYYFDDYMVRNELKDIGGRVYYFQDDGKLAMNKTFEIENKVFIADENGVVRQ